MAKNDNKAAAGATEQLTPEQIREAEDQAEREQNERIAAEEAAAHQKRDDEEHAELNRLAVERAEQDQRDKDAEAARLAAEAEAAAAADSVGLVPMHKDGATLNIHPTCVKAHESAGWQAVEK